MKKQVLFTILMLLPLVAMADDSGKCGENLTWTYKEATKTLTISGNGEMSYNKVPWNSYKSSIEKIIIDEGVTSIGDNAFQYCSGLTSVSIGNSVTSIGIGAFYGCSGLTSITIPDGVTSIDGYAFESCTGLTSVTIPNSVTNVGDLAFQGCSGLTSVELGMSNYGGSVFFGCSNLTKMILHGKSVSLSWLDQKPKYSEETSNIKEQIKEIVIGDDVNSINRVAFSGFTNLTSVDIPSSVTSIGNSAFSGCTNLATIKIPESVTSIGTGAFADCINLASIFFPENISIGSGAFDNTAWFNSFEDGLIYFGNTLYQYKGIIPENSTITIKEGTTLINTLAFNSCTGLCSITIPSSVTYIASRAFFGCI